MVSIFISSTYSDLKKHREVLMNQLLEAGYTTIDMEHFGSRAGDAQTVSIADVEKADVFVGIYAYRYGYRPDDDKSVTEMEYLTAKKREPPLDRLVFLVDPTYHDALLDQYAENEGEPKMLLDIFKRRLEKEHVRLLFTSPEDLAGKVVASLHRWSGDHPPEDKLSKSDGGDVNTGDVRDSIVGRDFDIKGGLHFNGDSSSSKKGTDS